MVVLEEPKVAECHQDVRMSVYQNVTFRHSYQNKRLYIVLGRELSPINYGI